MAVPVLVLQTFASQRGTSSRTANQESATPHIGGRPDQVPNALEPEHRVIDEKGNRVDSVIRVGATRRNQRAHRSSFSDALFENLTVLRLFVIEQRVHVDRFIVLADARIDSHLPEQRFHAESARPSGTIGTMYLPSSGSR